MSRGTRILSENEVAKLLEAYIAALLYLALCGAFDDLVGAMEADRASAADVIALMLRAMKVAREFSARLDLGEEYEIVATSMSRRVLVGGPGRIRVVAGSFTFLGRSDLRDAIASGIEADKAVALFGTEMIDVIGESERHPELGEVQPPFVVEGPACMACRAALDTPDPLDGGVFRDLAIYRCGHEPGKTLPFSLLDLTDADGRAERRDHEAALADLPLSDLLILQETAEGLEELAPDEQEGEGGEAGKRGGEDEGEDGGVSPATSGRASADSAFGPTIETIDPAGMVQVLLETLTDIASHPLAVQRVPADPRRLRSALQGWVAAPLTDQDMALLGEPHSRAWDGLVRTRPAARANRQDNVCPPRYGGAL
jgi:hypothetical protein